MNQLVLPRATPAEVGLDAQRCDRLMAVLRADAARARLPGGVVLVARHGRVALHEAFGVQAPTHGVAPDAAAPMRTDSLFRIYSMTKPIVSVATMMLVERGQLLLSDPVQRFIPSFAATPVAVEQGGAVSLRAPARPATVHDLLRHTAGLTYEFLGTAHVQRAYVQARLNSRDRSNAELCDALAALPLMCDPGSAWEYSRATDVLGRVLEVVTGQTLGDFLRDAIFTPLGMTDTAFRVPESQWHRIAEPFAHDPDGGVPFRVFDPRVAARLELGGGGLMSTTRDYARFLQMMLNRGVLDGVRLLSPATVGFMTADHLGSIPVNGALLPAGHGFGLGFAVRKTPGEAAVPGSAGLYYWGGIAGTTFFVDPVEDLFAMLMIQAPNQRDHYRELFRNLVYATLMETRA